MKRNKNRAFSDDGGQRYADIIARAREEILREDTEPHPVRDSRAATAEKLSRLHERLEDARSMVKTLEKLVWHGHNWQAKPLQKAREKVNALAEELDRFLFMFRDAAADIVGSHQAQLRALNRRNREFWKVR